MERVKPPRQKREGQRRLDQMTVSKIIGVEPLPLVERRIFGTFVSGQKYRSSSYDEKIPKTE